MTFNRLLFSLIRSEILQQELSCGIVDDVDRETLKQLFITSKKYDITHIIASALLKSPLKDNPDVVNNFTKEIALAVYRCESMNSDYRCICEVLEQTKIPYIPLKGSVIRSFYPEEWMRTSCDIDILVKEEDLDRAVEEIGDKLGFSCKGQRDYHDISLFSKTGTHLELHFNIKENMPDIDKLLDKVWDYAEPQSQDSYHYEMTNEFLLFHNLAHMSYHVLNGGCGIRSFIDIFLLEKKLEYNDELLCSLCCECGISAFKEQIEKLVGVWFDNKEHDDVSLELEEYILSGGLYGNLNTASAIMHEKAGGKWKYIASRVFQPYSILQEKYPVLRKHKWLMPVCQVRRWVNILTTDRRKKIVRHINAGDSVSVQESARKIRLLTKLGLFK